MLFYCEFYFCPSFTFVIFPGSSPDRLLVVAIMLSRWPRPFLLLLILRVQSCESSICADNSTADHKVVTLAAILPLTNTDYAWAWPRVAPALYRAVRQVNSDPRLLPGLELRLVHGSSENREGFCSDSMAPLVAVDLKQSNDPWAFIGPGCDYSSSPVARFTTHWDVPMVTAGARAIGFEHYAAVTNTGPTHKKLGEFGMRIQETFGWRQHAMLIFSDNKDANDDRPCYFAVEGLYTLLGKHNITIRDHSIDADSLNYKTVVQEIRDHGRGQTACTAPPPFSSSFAPSFFFLLLFSSFQYVFFFSFPLPLLSLHFSISSVLPCFIPSFFLLLLFLLVKSWLIII